MTEEDTVYRLKNPRVIKNVELCTIHIADIDPKDHPDYVDAYVDEAFWINGDKLSEDDLDWLMNDHQGLVYNAIYEQIF